jgi:hypothetical protein
LSFTDYAESLATGAFPTGIHEAVGVRWTREVKSASYSQQYQDVFIAPGVTAEGLAQGGYLGVALSNVALVFILLLTCRALVSRRWPLVMAGCVFAFDSALYEGGILWILEGGAGALQVAFLTWLVMAAFAGRGAGPQSRTHALARDAADQPPDALKSLRDRPNAR